MNFLYYYNWLRFSILTPSYFAKNRLWIERSMHNRLIYSYFGFTFKSFIWTNLLSINLNDYLWKNIYYCFIIIFSYISLCIIFNFNFLVFNFPVKYWLMYISWRIFDGFYFFFLQIQYLIVISLISSSWYVLNTYFNIQLNLLYLIIFNYFNINTDIQTANIVTKNYKLLYIESLQLLFNSSNLFKIHFFDISYYFYLIKLYLNIIKHNVLFSTIYSYSYWNNFNYDRQFTLVKLNNNYFYLFNLVKHKWFLLNNANTIYNNTYFNINFSLIISNWFEILKLLRWNIYVSNLNNFNIFDIKLYNWNIYTKNLSITLPYSHWFTSLEWNINRWLLVFNSNKVKNLFYLNVINKDNTIYKNYYITNYLLKYFYFNKYIYNILNFDIDNYNSNLQLFSNNFDIVSIQTLNNFFSFQTKTNFYFLLQNNTFNYYNYTFLFSLSNKIYSIKNSEFIYLF